MIKVCKYCSKEIEFEKIQQFAGHVSNCILNPNKQEKFKKVSETLKSRDYSHLLKSLEYVVECQKCNKEYIVKVTPEAYNKKRYKKYCSRSCANSRQFSKESKEKTKETLTNYYLNPDNFSLVEQRTLQSINTKSKRQREGVKYKTSKVLEKEIECTCCKKTFISKRTVNNTFSTLCSNECYIKVKRHNAKGIKRQEYKGQIFDSGYEVEVAKWLDKNSIEWVKDKVIFWEDNRGKQHRYFPDFYLPEYNIYLDPKNEYCIEHQKEKLEVVQTLITLIYGTPEHVIKTITTYNRSKLRT